MKVLAPDLAKLADFHLALSTAEHGSEISGEGLRGPRLGVSNCR